MLKPILVALLALSLLLPVVADTITLNAVDRGWFNLSGTHNTSNKNTCTGQTTNGYRSFFVFSIPNLSQAVVSATLRLELESCYNASPQTFTVYDFQGNESQLSVNFSSGDNTGQAIYNDLGTGNIYATRTIYTSDVNTILEITLSAQAIADITNASGSLFAVGQRNSVENSSNYLRFSAGDEVRTHQLVLQTTSVPEPAGVALLAVGLLALWIRNKKI